MNSAAPIWTVGHSNQEISGLVELLLQSHIVCVVDVRSSPWSRYVPQFNREELARSLDQAGIQYEFMGEALGGRPSRDDHIDDEGRAHYGAMAATPEFERAISTLTERVRQSRIALLCAEADPSHCHRRLLVGKVLCERGLVLRHIQRDGTIQEEARVTLPGQTGQASLFEGEEIPWRSTQSVSHKAPPSTSSDA